MTIHFYLNDEEETFITSFYNKKIILVREDKYIDINLIEDNTLIIEYHCNFIKN